MTTKPSAPSTTAGSKLIARIAAAQKRADAAKRTAKLAKLDLRTAKQKFKNAKHAAKKLRKAIKALKAELAEIKEKKPARKAAPRKSTARKPAVKRTRPVPSSAPLMTAEVRPGPSDSLPPAVPAQ